MVIENTRMKVHMKGKNIHVNSENKLFVINFFESFFYLFQSYWKIKFLVI